MIKERLSDKEAICILITFLLGSSLIVGIGGDSKNDAWISGMLSLIMYLPMLLIYSRLLSLYQDKDLFDILIIVFGKVFGRIAAVIYIWYAFHLGALVLRNFGEFINTVAMPETPLLVPLICLQIVCATGVCLGLEVVGRITTYFLPLILFIILLVQLLGIPQLHFNYLKPILGNGIIPVMKGAFSTFAFPFAETVLFTGIFSSLQTKKSPVKVFLFGTLISAFVIVTLTIRNIAVLGNMLGSFYFPSYEAVSRINIGDFIQRVEVTVSIVFVFGVFLKTSICLMVTCKGIGKVLNLKDYRSITIQTGLIMTYFSYTVYDNIMDMKFWISKVYLYYAFPMQVIIPVILWVFAEIKSKKIQQKLKPN